MIAALLDQERSIAARRAQASAGAAEPFADAEEVELRRIQALRASLEMALSCAQSASAEAQQLAEVAARQASVWRERQAAA